MSYKLFLDDERFPVAEGWVIARTVDEAIMAVFVYGFPGFISFDHDLGTEQSISGYDNSGIGFAKWIIDQALDNKITIPQDFEFYVHSQNPIGAHNIQALMDSFLENVC